MDPRPACDLPTVECFYRIAGRCCHAGHLEDSGCPLRDEPYFVAGQDPASGHGPVRREIVSSPE